MNSAKTTQNIGLPRSAQKLVDTAIAHGWSYAVQWGKSIQDYVFVTVTVIGDETGRYQLTWHTRETGTFRLFSLLDYVRRVEMPSLTSVIEVIERNPQQWVLEILH